MAYHNIFLLAAALFGGFTAIAGVIIARVRENRLRQQLQLTYNQQEHDLEELRREFRELRAQRNRSRNSINRPDIISDITSELEYYSARDNNSVIDEEQNEIEENNLADIEPLDFTDIDLILEDDSNSDIFHILEKLNRLKDKHPENYDVMYRLAIAYEKVACCQSDTEEKKRYIINGIKICEFALTLTENDAKCHKQLAKLYGLKCELLPVTAYREQIAEVENFKKHADIAFSLAPDDPEINFMLGRFTFIIAGLGWFERTAVRTLSAEIPAVTYKDALRYFTTAEENSEFYANSKLKENRLFIGKCYINMNMINNGVTWLRKADGTNKTVDESVLKEIRDLLEQHDR